VGLQKITLEGRMRNPITGIERGRADEFFIEVLPER
jgi:hypothetical protein